MLRLDFDLQAMVKPKNREDCVVLMKEIAFELANINGILDSVV